VSEYVWGVDPGLARVAFAFAEVGSELIEVETLYTARNAREGERLGLLDRQVRIFARQRAAEFPPTVVWTEQPSGRHRNLPLTYAVGVIQAALFETLGGVPVWSIPSGTWKRRALGDGGASKEQVAAWVLKQGADFNGQDEADAFGIAHAGRTMVTSGKWEAA
jgi:Holliday junction resolvasome RuvABC endonuclease subunit